MSHARRETQSSEDLTGAPALVMIEKAKAKNAKAKAAAAAALLTEAEESEPNSNDGENLNEEVEEGEEVESVTPALTDLGSDGESLSEGHPKLTKKEAVKEANDSKEILREAAKLKHLAADTFTPERVANITAFLASRKLIYLTPESLESLYGLMLNDKSKDLLEAAILTMTIEVGFTDLAVERQVQISDWTDRGWSMGGSVMSIMQMHDFLVDEIRPRLTENAQEQSSPAQRADAKLAFVKNVGTLIKAAATGNLN